MMCEEKLRELGLFSLRRLEGQEAAVTSCRKKNPTWTYRKTFIVLRGESDTGPGAQRCWGISIPKDFQNHPGSLFSARYQCNSHSSRDYKKETFLLGLFLNASRDPKHQKYHLLSEGKWLHSLRNRDAVTGPRAMKGQEGECLGLRQRLVSSPWYGTS